jgi:predicted NACHT family NTPase
LDDNSVFDLINTGVVIFLLDGFDEIQQKNREVIIRDIRQFIDKAHSCWYVLTSRPEPSLTAFGDFQQFNIHPLKNQEAFELIGKYDKIKNLGVAPQLIKDIQAKLTQIKSFLTNPFLVSLLYKTYTYTQDIPASKITFYDEVYSALFKHHDLSKGGWQRPKKSKLEIQQFRIVLRQLAFDTLKVNLVSYSKQDALQFIKLVKEKCIGIDFDDQNFLDDLLSAVPLFLDDGLKVKWLTNHFKIFLQPNIYRLIIIS